MDRSKYTKKCLQMLSTKQFTIVENDPTKPLESKLELTIRKSKSKNPNQECKHISNRFTARQILWYCKITQTPG